MSFDRLLAVVLVAGSAASGQTRIDLGSQGKAVDFSAAATTKPAKTGVSLPATCSTGEMYFKSDAVPGQNLYLCTSTNSWVQMVGTGGSGSAVWGAIGGTLSSQSDLQSALSAKAALSHAHAASDLTTGTIAPERLGTGTPNSSTFLRGNGQWVAIPGGTATPGGANGTIQINNDGSFGGRLVGNGLVLDSTNLYVDGTLVATLGDPQTFSGTKTFSGTTNVSGASAVLDASGALRTIPERVITAPPTGSCRDGEKAVLAGGMGFTCSNGLWASGTPVNNGTADPTCNATSLGVVFLNTAANPSVMKICGKNSSGAYTWGTLTVTGW